MVPPPRCSRRRTSTTPDQVMVCLSSRGGDSEALLPYPRWLRLNGEIILLRADLVGEPHGHRRGDAAGALHDARAGGAARGDRLHLQRGRCRRDDSPVRERIPRGQGDSDRPARNSVFWDRLGGGLTIPERIMAGGRNIAVVIVDTRGIVEEQAPTAEVPPAAGEAGIEGGRSRQKDAADHGETGSPVGRAAGKRRGARQLVKACCRHDPGIREGHLRKSAWNGNARESRSWGRSCEFRTPGSKRGYTIPVLALGVSKVGVRGPSSGRGGAHPGSPSLSRRGRSNSHVKLLGGPNRMVRDTHCGERHSRRGERDGDRRDRRGGEEIRMMSSVTARGSMRRRR